MTELGGLWAVATVLGPLLLLSAMIYGVIVYRRRGPATQRRTEEGTRALYREGSERERRRGAAEAPVDSPPLSPDISPRNRSSVDG